MTENAMTVGQVAAEYGVTVRTLHHYDAVGLVVPSERGHNGYRYYTAADLQRLQHVVVYRRLGFALEEIAALLEADADVAAHLRRQRDSVMARVDELTGLVHAIDAALEAEMNEYEISKDERQELFGHSFEDEYAQEAADRWGDTPEWAESQRRAKSYTKGQWEQIAAENEANQQAFGALLRAGTPADSVEAMDLAEAGRLHICRWFYECPRELQAKIATLYVTDPRFEENFSKVEPGLAQYVHDAIVANAARPR